MVPTFSPYIDLSPIARHEAAHALHGFLVGHKVERIKVTRDDAYTVLICPVTPARLPALFHGDPARWSVELQKIIGTITAGPLAEGVNPYGRDAESLKQWEAAYRQCGAEISDWHALTGAVQRALCTWQRRGSVGCAVASLAHMLRQARIAEEFAIQFMLGEIGVQGIPEPYYEPIALSNTRWPSSSTRPARRPAASTPVERRNGQRLGNPGANESEERERFFAQLNKRSPFRFRSKPAKEVDPDDTGPDGYRICCDTKPGQPHEPDCPNYED